MDTYVSTDSLQTPTNVIKNLDNQTTQSLTIINEKDFRKFVPSGWKVVIDLPLARTTNRAIFAINIDGYMPYWNLSNDFYMAALKNLAPVQAFPHSLGYVHIYHEQITVPIMTMYTAHRVIAGNVKVGLRVQGNTTQSGSFLVTQASTCIRNYTRNTEIYTGLRFINSSDQGTDYAMESFFLGDLSINRNWSISPMAKNTLPRVDLAMKLDYLDKLTRSARTTNDLLDHGPFLNQFTEDWLFFTPLAALPNNNANQITFEVFFDYTDVQFYTPLLPFLSSANVNSNNQVLDVTGTIVGRNFTNKNQAVWVSNTPQTEEEEQAQL